MIFAKGGQVWKGGLYTPILAKGAESEMVAFVLLFSHKVAKPESGSKKKKPCTDRLFPKMGECREVLGGGPAPPSKL